MERLRILATRHLQAKLNRVLRPALSAFESIKIILCGKKEARSGRCTIAGFQHSGSDGLFLRSVCQKNDGREGSLLGETFPLTEHLNSEMSTV
jgi:hypothetical protein